MLGTMVAAASYTPETGQKDGLGNVMRAEVKARVRGLLGTWNDLLLKVSEMAERRKNEQWNADVKNKDDTVSESEKQDVLSATGVVWNACDTLIKLCDDGVVGLTVKKVQAYRATLLDATEEMREWGEDVEDDRDDAEFSDEDDLIRAANKIGKDNAEIKAFLAISMKKLKMIELLYKALIKRRLRTYPASLISFETTSKNDISGTTASPSERLDALIAVLKSIPEIVDDLASAFYDLDLSASKQTLQRCCGEAKEAIRLAQQSWTGTEDEFTVWLQKCRDALDTA